MRIAITGSGRVEAYVRRRLQATGVDVSFIARGAHLDVMQKVFPGIIRPLELS